MSFAKILSKGKRKYHSKAQTRGWHSCEYCGERKQVFQYQDNKKEFWMLCEDCVDMFIEEEE